ncbi:atp3 gamma subunit of the F1 sector of mitochondrial F1F0 ATP synthase [Allomyces javanicus]|nr:atp3 gamma subunit of the F1 sector of mitochondrial F1F0 ATP synthase [Allomyces javanicus]
MLSSASRPVARAAVQYQQQANMATLKEIQLRLKSITNIAKITKSMKMIASTKMMRAQRNMDAARVYGTAATAVTKHAGVEAQEGKTDLYIAVSSDRGLCGGVHSAVTKATKKAVAAQEGEGGLVVLGDKCRSQLSRDLRDNMKMNFNQLGKNVPTFLEASLIVDQILRNTDLKADKTAIVYNKFLSVIAYEPTHLPVVSQSALATAPKLSTYEMEEGDVLKDLSEFVYASALYWAMAEGHAAEMSSRRTAMDNATKNAGEMIDRLTLSFNRQRQATITNDLVDIITGASAL